MQQDVPAWHNGFIYAIEGSVQVSGTADLEAEQVGWLEQPRSEESAMVSLTAGGKGARLLFYAGKRQGDPIVVQGPFVGDSNADLTRLYRAYRAGQFPLLSAIATVSGR
jgi:redox-sensitive bicupin YhaK (pirin superfamily)